MANLKVVILDPYTSQPLKGVTVEAHDVSDGSFISTAITNDQGVAEFSLTTDASFHARTVNTPPLYQIVFPVLPGLGPFDYDYLVDVNWATIVAAGDGTEGQTFTTFHGHTFRVYSTIQGAIDHHETLAGGTVSSVRLVPGTYDEQITITPVSAAGGLYIYGSGMGDTIIKPTSGSGNVVTVDSQSFAVTGGTWFQDVLIDSSLLSGAAFCVKSANPTVLGFEKVAFVGDSGDTGLSTWATPAGKALSISQCAFYVGTGITLAGANAQIVLITNSGFFTGCDIGIHLDSAHRYRITGCAFTSAAAIGIQLSGNQPGLSSIGDNDFSDLATGIDFQTNNNSIDMPLSVTGNTFISCDIGLDFTNSAQTVRSIAIGDNNFKVTSTEIGIKGSLTKMNYCTVVGNVFSGYDADNEMQNVTGTGNEVAHNTTDSGATLPDTHVASGAIDHPLLDGDVHEDTVADAVTAGSIIIGNDTPKWDELVISVPAAGSRNVLAIDNGETLPSWKGNDILIDADGDTGYEVEQAADEDIHHFKTGGTEVLLMGDTGGAGEFGGVAHQMHFPMQGDQDILIDGSTNERSIDTGVMRFEQKPSIVNTRCLTLNIDANSEPGTHGEVINMTATQIAAGEIISAYQINFITGNASGGHAHGFEVSLVGAGGLDDVVGLHVNPGVAVIHQESGTFGNVESAWENALDVTTPFNTSDPGPGANNVELFSAENDVVTIGMDAAFDHIEVILETLASGAGIKPTFHFSIAGPGWTAFMPDDETLGFRQSGIIDWDISDLTNWVATTDNGVSKYWIRITRTAVALTTPPIEDTIQAQAITEFSWDPLGDISANDITAAGTLDVGTYAAIGAALSPAIALRVEETWNDAANSHVGQGAAFAVTASGSGTDRSIKGVTGTATSTLTNKPTAVIGLDFNSFLAGSAGATLLLGVRSGLVTAGGSSGGIDEAIGFELVVALVGSGKADRVTGLHIPDLSTFSTTGDEAYGVRIDAMDGDTDPTRYAYFYGDVGTPLWYVSPTGSVFIAEKAAADGDIATLGQLWVLTATPNELWFTDDAGTDMSITTPKQSIIIRAGALTPNTTNPCADTDQDETATGGKNYQTRAFAANEQGSFEMALPPNYDGGTVTWWYYWISPTGSSAGDTVIFGLRGSSSQDGDAISEAQGGQITITDTVITGAGVVHRSAESSALTIAGSPSGEDPVIWEVERTGGTMSEEAQLWMAYVRYGTTQPSNV